MEDDVDPAVDVLEPEKCTNTSCINDTDEKVLQCNICKRRVHLQCSLLPPYQLHRHLNYHTYHAVYVCANCITAPENLKEIYERNQHKQLKQQYEKELEKSINLELKFELLLEEMAQKDAEVKELKENLGSLATNTISNPSKQKKRRINEEP